MLQVTNVKKYYGSFLAVDIPSLYIEEGVWWVKGENGSGKTTFLKMLAGLHPFSGNIVLEKAYTITKNRKEFLRLVNYAEAEPLYPSFLTPRDLVELYCETKRGSLSYAQELLQQLNVFDAYNKPMASCSSGMIKKVSLALAFIGQPKLILLDEPLITIDAKAVEVICGIINKHCQKGISFIITSHQPVHREQLMFTGQLSVENRTISKNN